MVDLPDGNLASWAVAAGTLFLGVVAYYQARLLVRERKANQAREMMEKIYLPLRAEVRSWLLPEGNDFGHWKMVNDQYPHLTPSVPDELGPIFVEAGPLMLRIQTLSLEVRDLISKASRAMTEKMRLHSNVVGGSGYVSFGVLRAGFNDAFFVSYLKEVWLSGKSLTTYLSQRVEEQWPGLEWTMDIRLDGQPAGNMQQAQEFSKGALEMLVHPPSAREYREKLAKKKDLADKALSIINSQIEKYSGIFKPLRARIKSRFKH